MELGAQGRSDSELVSSIIEKLCPALEKIRPAAAVFLGDTNTVMGCIAAAQLNIPIIHIEGCMRSYDWRMPEEKYRIVADHLADIIYAYLDEYKRQGVSEGLNPRSIVVTGNPIVDVLEKFYLGNPDLQRLANHNFFHSRNIEKGEYYVMTFHRRENVEDSTSLTNVLELLECTNRRIYFPASYRTQRAIRKYSLKLPQNVVMVDPVGYREFLLLVTNSRGVLSDSGTVIEEACILQIPAVQLRKSTERPQVYDVGACVKFDPTSPQAYLPELVFDRLESLNGKHWLNPFGNGKSSERIAQDIVKRLEDNTLKTHGPGDYHLDTNRAYRNDDIR
jgi:UDP-N-acetylglucosamine 2-epimerase (non-hydrolysing)